MIARIAAFFVAVGAIWLLAAAPLLAQGPKPQPGLAIENEFVRAVVNRGMPGTGNDKGRFSIRTTGGDPAIVASQNKDLIYGGDIPWTSFTTVRIDNKDYVFGGATTKRSGNGLPAGEVIQDPEIKDGKIITTCRFGEVVVSQELGIVRGVLGNRYSDTVAITYRMENTGEGPHQVGLRVMIDTKCGDNDGAPIRPAGMKDPLNTPRWLVGKEVPSNWIALEGLQNPGAVSQGTLTGGLATPPDRVVFADWGTLADNPWDAPAALPGDFIRAGEEEIDTAAAYYWNTIRMEAGQKRAYTTYYGISALKVQPRIAIMAPSETTYNYDERQPFDVIGYIQNEDTTLEARNVNVTLTLPEGLELVGGDDLARVTIPRIKPGEMKQLNWRVWANGKASGKFAISLSAVGDNLPQSSIDSDITVNVPVARLEFNARAKQVSLMEGGYASPVLIGVMLAPADSFYGIEFTLNYDPQVIKPLGMGFGALTGRAFGAAGVTPMEYDTTVPGRIVFRQMRGNAPKLRQGDAEMVVLRFRTVGKGDAGLRVSSAKQYTDPTNTRPLEARVDAIQVVDQAAQ